jgi:hypothetical protein
MHVFSIHKIDVQCMENSNEHYVKNRGSKSVSENSEDPGSSNL